MPLRYAPLLTFFAFFMLPLIDMISLLLIRHAIADADMIYIRHDDTPPIRTHYATMPPVAIDTPLPPCY